MNELYIRRSPKVVYRRLGQETMVMSATDSALFGLNEVGSVIWESADGRTPLCDIVDRCVCEQFDVEPAVALQDVTVFVEELAKHGILLISDQPVLPAAAETGALR
jgi:hypothetical protein